MRPVPSRRLLAVLAASTLALAACSGSGDAPSVASLDDGDVAAAGDDGATEAVDSDEAMLEFAACMREQGLDFPDPVADDDGTLRFAPPGDGDGGGFASIDRETIEAARDACGDILEGLAFGPGGGGPGGGEFDSEAFLAFATCMREQGIEDFPDPGADGRPDIEAMQQLDVQSDEFQAAAETCSDEDSGFGFRFGGPGGPGGQGGPPPGDQGGQTTTQG